MGCVHCKWEVIHNSDMNIMLGFTNHIPKWHQYPLFFHVDKVASENSSIIENKASLQQFVF